MKARRATDDFDQSTEIVYRAVRATVGRTGSCCRGFRGNFAPVAAPGIVIWNSSTFGDNAIDDETRSPRSARHAEGSNNTVIR